MILSQCKNCQKIFKSKQALSYHIKNNVCKKHEHICEYCSSQLSSKQMLEYHMSKKVCEKREKPIENGYDVENYKIKLKKADEHIRNLENEICFLKGENKALKEHPQTQNNVVIFPNAYGKENINHILKKLGDILGPLLKNQTFHSIPSLFEKIHTAKQLPEYHNVYTTSEKSGFALVSDGERFRNRPKKTVIDQIIEEKRSILNNYVDNNEKQLGKEVLNKYEKYQDKLDSDPAFRRNLELEIGGLLLDMKSIIANDDLTRHLLKKLDEGNFELD